MLLEKIKTKLKSINKIYLLSVLLIVVFMLTRVPGLYNDNINPDGINWHWRSEQFMNGIKYQQFEKTYQHYQPGVTLMWIIGPIVELPKQIFTNFDTYSPVTFPIFHFYSKLFLVLVQLILTFISFYVLEKLIGVKKAFLTILIFTIEPFFVGNSRVLHMDVLLTLFLFNGLLFAFWNLKEFDWWKVVVAGFFLGLAPLTKSIGIGAPLYVAGVGGLYLLLTQDFKKALKYSLPILGISLATIFLFFPALWTNGKFVLGAIYRGITDKGFDGHGEIFFGKYTRDPGWLFYPVVLLIKSSPFFIIATLIGIGECIKSFIKKREMSLETYLGIFYIGFFIVISIVSKKIDRYIIPVYPYLSLLAAGGLIFLFKKNIGKIFSALLFLLFVSTPLIRFYPYYFTYVNPLFGSPKHIHENILAQKPFGIGVFELKDYIINNYGINCKEGLNYIPEDSTVCKARYPRLAQWDPKPFNYIYNTDNLKFTKIDSPDSFDILVVGVDEEFPERVKENEYNFVHDHSIHINGLEYWKIYVRGQK